MSIIPVVIVFVFSSTTTAKLYDIIQRPFDSFAEKTYH